MPQSSEEGYWSAQVPSLAVAVSVSLIISSSNCSPIAKERSHTGAMALRSPALLGSGALWMYLPSVLPFQHRTASLAPSTSLVQIGISAGRKPPGCLPHPVLSTCHNNTSKSWPSPNPPGSISTSPVSTRVDLSHSTGADVVLKNEELWVLPSSGTLNLGVPAVLLAVYTPESGKSSESQRKKYASLAVTVSGWLWT